MPRPRFASLTALAALLLLSSTVLAAGYAPEPPPTPWQYQVLELVLSTLGAVVTACVPVVALWLTRKLRLGHEALVQAEVSRVVTLGVAYAEEQARKAAAGKLGGSAVGGEKLQVAADWVMAQLAARGNLPDLTAAHAKSLIEAHLGLSRPADPTLAAPAPLPPVPPAPAA